MFVMQMLRAFHQAHNNLRSLLAKAHKSFPPMASTAVVFTHLNIADPLLHSNRLFADRLLLFTSFLEFSLLYPSFSWLLSYRCRRIVENFWLEYYPFPAFKIAI